MFVEKKHIYNVVFSCFALFRRPTVATYDYGGHRIKSVIMSDSYLPREIHFGMGDYFANYFFDNIGITFRQQGLERIMDRIHSPRNFVRVLVAVCFSIIIIIIYFYFSPPNFSPGWLYAVVSSSSRNKYSN